MEQRASHMVVMTSHERQAYIINRCKALGVDQVGLRSIRQFVEAGLNHAQAPLITAADQHVALNSNLRFATNRIACQGRHGHSVAQCRLLSRAALALRDSLAIDESIPPENKFSHWFQQVTEEHQDPVASVGDSILVALDTITVDEIVERLLIHPSVIVTRHENRHDIPRGMKHRGEAAARYVVIGAPVLVEEGTMAFFDRMAGRTRRSRASKYDVDHVPWP